MIQILLNTHTLPYTEFWGYNNKMPIDTYIPIAKTVLSSNQSTVTFSSISGSYTDLVLVISTAGSSANLQAYIRFNNSSSNIYSVTEISGNGTTVSSYRTTSTGEISLSPSVAMHTTLGQGQYIVNILNYANTTTNKTALIRTGGLGATYQGTAAVVGLWRSTAAIDRIDIKTDVGNFVANSTFTLYGIHGVI